MNKNTIPCCFICLLCFSLHSVAGDEGSEESANCFQSESQISPNMSFCFGLEITGAYHDVQVENDAEGFDHSFTEHEVTPLFEVQLLSKDGWTAEGVFEWESVNEENGESYSETTEAYVSLKHNEADVMLLAGLMDLGGIDQGNEFMTELGEDIVGDYGNIGESQSYIAVGVEPLEGLNIVMGYSSRVDDISFEETFNEGEVSSVNVVLEWELGELNIGAEYEYFDYKNNRQNLDDDDEKNRTLDSETAYGISLSFELFDQLIPFINYGVASLNDEENHGNKNDTFTSNIGLDFSLNEQWGVTLGMELIEDDRRIEEIGRSDDVKNVYLGTRYMIDKAHIGLSLWKSDQEERQDNDNVETQLTFEVGIKL